MVASEPSTKDDKKTRQNEIADLEAAMDDDKEPTLKIKIEDLDDDSRALDKEVANYIEQREAAHAEYYETLASNKAAVDKKNKLTRGLGNITKLIDELVGTSE